MCVASKVMQAKGRVVPMRIPDLVSEHLVSDRPSTELVHNLSLDL